MRTRPMPESAKTQLGRHTRQPESGVFGAPIGGLFGRGSVFAGLEIALRSALTLRGAWRVFRRVCQTIALNRLGNCWQTPARIIRPTPQSIIAPYTTPLGRDLMGLADPEAPFPAVNQADCRHSGILDARVSVLPNAMELARHGRPCALHRKASSAVRVAGRTPILIGGIACIGPSTDGRHWFIHKPASLRASALEAKAWRQPAARATGGQREYRRFRPRQGTMAARDNDACGASRARGR